jgi:hypothetical protein
MANFFPVKSIFSVSFFVWIAWNFAGAFSWDAVWRLWLLSCSISEPIGVACSHKKNASLYSLNAREMALAAQDTASRLRKD